MTDRTLSKEHKVDTCMCDACIQARTIKRVLQEQMERTTRAYEERRGGKLGSISVSDALKGRKP